MKEEYNGVLLESSFSDKQFLYGKGAGSFPTASAILSDLSALRYGYRYEYKKLFHAALRLTLDFHLRVYICFTDAAQLPSEKSSVVEEWYCDAEQQYLVAVLPFTELIANDWWRQKGISLIAMPEPVVTNKTKDGYCGISLQPALNLLQAKHKKAKTVIMVERIFGRKIVVSI